MQVVQVVQMRSGVGVQLLRTPLLQQRAGRKLLLERAIQLSLVQVGRWQWRLWAGPPALLSWGAWRSCSG